MPVTQMVTDPSKREPTMFGQLKAMQTVHVLAEMLHRELAERLEEAQLMRWKAARARKSAGEPEEAKATTRSELKRKWTPIGGRMA
jgi:hypothetical protein